jgi:hypothetical protein
MAKRDLSTPLSVSSFDFEGKPPKKRGTRKDRKKQKQEQSKPAPDAMKKKKAAPVENNVDSKKKLLKKEWHYDNLPGSPTQKATKYSKAAPKIKRVPLSILNSDPSIVGTRIFHKDRKRKKGSNY